MCGGIFNSHFIVNFLENLLLKFFLENRSRFEEVTAVSLVFPFYETYLYITISEISTNSQIYL